MAILSKGFTGNYVSEKALIVASAMYFQHFAYIEWRIWFQNNEDLDKTCSFLKCCFCRFLGLFRKDPAYCRDRSLHGLLAGIPAL